MKSYINIINNINNNFNNISNIKTYFPISPFYKSLLIYHGDPQNFQPYDSLINNIFGENYISKIIKEEKDDIEYSLHELTNYIEKIITKITIVDGLTGEILMDITITPEILEKPFWEIIPFEFFKKHNELFAKTK